MKREWLVISLLTALFACGGDEGPAGEADAGAEQADAMSSVELPATEREWVWVPVPGVECMDGSPTGMGVNLSRSSSKLLIVFEGGGACFDAVSCLGAAHQSGYFPVDFDKFVANLGGTGVFDRDDPDNPFSDWSYAFLPYCTGDIFAASLPAPDGFGSRNMVGYRNVGIWTDVLVDNLGDSLDKVVLSGFSAGGFGALYNYDRVQRAFGEVPVLLLDDSGPILGSPYLTDCLRDELKSAWGLVDTLPAECTECVDNFSALLSYLTSTYSDRNFALVSSLGDGTIRTFYGLGYPDCESPTGMSSTVYGMGIAALRDEIMAGVPNFRMYTLSGPGHVFTIGAPLATTISAGVPLADWLNGFLTGQGWDTVVPAN